MHRVDLPVELWHETFRHLQRSEQRAVLGVSRIFHDIAMRFLFSTVKIYFTAWDAYTEAGAPPSFVRTRYESELLLNTSWEILDYIVDNSTFAQVVKKVIVYAFAQVGEAVFEQRKLES
jgi:hypothetical protein